MEATMVTKIVEFLLTALGILIMGCLGLGIWLYRRHENSLDDLSKYIRGVPSVTDMKELRERLRTMEYEMALLRAKAETGQLHKIVK
jgi:hypothetical protein